ncbi:hypothetical protein FOA52_010836 [Chlamydomonas sp. UWO 241]|nr:hypothetical protein FOA52_010836 [Chlamydomonas sp. UWO 241]
MLVAPPQAGAFPRLKSLAVDLEDEIQLAEYQVLAAAAPWLTALMTLAAPYEETDLPAEMAQMLAACTRLTSLRLCDQSCEDDGKALLQGIDAHSAATNLRSLNFTRCEAVSDLSPLASMVNLKSLTMDNTCASDLAPLSTLVNQVELDMGCSYLVSKLVPLSTLVNLHELSISECTDVSDLAPLSTMVSMQTLRMCDDTAVSDLTPLSTMVSLQTLDMHGCTTVSNLRPSAPW